MRPPAIRWAMWTEAETREVIFDFFPPSTVFKPLSVPASWGGSWRITIVEFPCLHIR